MIPATDHLEQALRHEGALRRLAAAICRCAADAEDALQHTWSQVAFGRRPHGVALLPFLRTTLRNHAFNLVKLSRRRRVREAVAAPSAVTVGVDELLAREQLCRHVAEAVRELDEPYRTTVCLRWFEGLRVAAIARLQNVPDNTVRSRLQRAHALLRVRLDRQYGDRQWAGLAAPLSVSLAGPGSALIVLGALVVKKTLLLAACAAAVLMFALWSPPPSRAVETASAPAGSVPVASAPDAPAAVRVPAETSPSADEPPAAAPAAADPTDAQLDAFAATAPPGCVEGIVLRGMQPIGGGRAWLRGSVAGGLPWGPTAGWDAAPGVQRAAIDAGGLFRFEGVVPDTYAVGIETPDGETRHVYLLVPDDGATMRLRFVLGSASVRARVFDDAGLPAVQWQVALYNVGSAAGGIQLILCASTDARGDVEFTGLCGCTYYLLASPRATFGAGSGPRASLDLAAGQRRDVILGSPATACQWKGRVLLPHGDALCVPGLVELEFECDGVALHDRADGRGQFEARLLAGTYRVRMHVGVQPRVELGTVEVPPGASSRDLVIPNAVRVRPKFVGTNEAPKWPRTSLVARLRRAGAPVLDSVRMADGFEYFLGVSPGTYSLQCWPHPIAGAPPGGVEVVVPAAGELEVDVVLGQR